MVPFQAAFSDGISGGWWYADRAGGGGVKVRQGRGQG